MPRTENRALQLCSFRNKIDILIVNGEPYFRKKEQKEGKIHNSTWLYFQGLTRKKEYRADEYISLIHHRFFPINGKMIVQKEELAERMGPFVMFQITAKNLEDKFDFRRFVDLPKMCISCVLGGGFWETHQGLKFSTFLKKNYPIYFTPLLDLQHTVKTQFAADNVRVIDHPTELNNWLKTHCNSEVAVGRTKLALKIHIEDTYSDAYKSSHCTIL